MAFGHYTDLVLDWLNRYANLLLVLITAIYAFLTWKTLGAMKSANVRDQRARHLDRIKESVAAPILMWLTSEVAGLLRGMRDAVHLMICEIPAQPRGQRPNQFAQVEPMVYNLDPEVLDDALHAHFEKQLKKFEEFKETFGKLFASFLNFAEQTRQEVEQDDQSLPPHDGSENQQRFADCPTIIRAYLRDLISGETSALTLLGRPGGEGALESPYSGGVTLAKAPYNALNAWLERFRCTVNGLWSRSGLHERIIKVRKDTDMLRNLMRQIEITETLPGKCKYINE